MEMIDILKGRLPEGLEIVKIKNKRSNSQTEILFKYKDTEGTGYLWKMCAPGHENNVCDATIFNVMAGISFKRGDLEATKYWLDKMKVDQEGD